MARFAVFLSMAIGFLSLSQEILWVRLVSFILKGLAQAFPLVLFLFLLGIAVGAAAGKRICERNVDLLAASSAVLAVAAAVDVGVVALLPILVSSKAGIGVILLAVALTAALKSVMFPIAHHLGSQSSGARIGRSVSKVYFGNIVGSTLGPIVTGYVLLDLLPVEQCFLVVAVATALLALACAARLARWRGPAPVLAALAVCCAFLVAGASRPTVPAIALATQSLAAGQARAPDATIRGVEVTNMVQNRHGIVHTVATADGHPDVILGGNIYDGHLNVDMGANYNGLDRGLVLLGVHPRPARVLMIGLSAGAWARILSSSPDIEELVTVEINPGYIDVIKRYPDVAPLLSDPRLKIVVDDGRRWLRSNPGEKFDLIVQNNTHSWRAYSSNLLSREYMGLVLSHLAPGGIAAFNTTYSADVLETARAVFPYVERRGNFVYGGATDFSRPTPFAEDTFRSLSLAGKPVFDEKAFAPGGLARDMIDRPFMSRIDQFEGLSASPGVITDQNLLSEHAHGKLRDALPGFYALVDRSRKVLPD